MVSVVRSLRSTNFRMISTPLPSGGSLDARGRRMPLPPAGEEVRPRTGGGVAQADRHGWMRSDWSPRRVVTDPPRPQGGGANGRGTDGVDGGLVIPPSRRPATMRGYGRI